MNTHVTLADIRRTAEQLWPAHTAEDWDRVGLTSGRDDQQITKILFSVDAVTDTVAEAVEWGANLLITHHPLMLRGVHTVAEDTAKGAMLAQLIRANCALLSAHTNADTPEGGVSDQIAMLLGIPTSAPIVAGHNPMEGLGRVGDLPEPLSLREFASRVASVLPVTAAGVRVAGDPDRMISRVALCGGAGDSLLDHELVRQACVYITSDLRHHPAQESLELSRVVGGPALIDVSHWASESLWLRAAAQQLRQAHPSVEIRVSEINTDPWTFQIG